MSEVNELIQAGQHLITIIIHAQGKYVMADYFLKREYPPDLSEEQIQEIREESVQAIIDIAAYRDMLRRLYEALGIPNPAE